jgi:hypothetical protein
MEYCFELWHKNRASLIPAAYAMQKGGWLSLFRPDNLPLCPRLDGWAGNLRPVEKAAPRRSGEGIPRDGEQSQSQAAGMSTKTSARKIPPTLPNRDFSGRLWLPSFLQVFDPCGERAGTRARDPRLKSHLRAFPDYQVRRGNTITYCYLAILSLPLFSVISCDFFLLVAKWSPRRRDARADCEAADNLKLAIEDWRRRLS